MLFYLFVCLLLHISFSFLGQLSLLDILCEVNKDSLCAHDIQPSVRLSLCPPICDLVSATTVFAGYHKICTDLAPTSFLKISIMIFTLYLGAEMSFYPLFLYFVKYFDAIQYILVTSRHSAAQQCLFYFF
jgi:hypothetical protein